MAHLWLIHASKMIKNCAAGYEELFFVFYNRFFPKATIGQV